MEAAEIVGESPKAAHLPTTCPGGVGKWKLPKLKGNLVLLPTFEFTCGGARRDRKGRRFLKKEKKKLGGPKVVSRKEDACAIGQDCQII